jgi:hypothetical protein
MPLGSNVAQTRIPVIFVSQKIPVSGLFRLLPGHEIHQETAATDSTTRVITNFLLRILRTQTVGFTKAQFRYLWPNVVIFRFVIFFMYISHIIEDFVQYEVKILEMFLLYTKFCKI